MSEPVIVVAGNFREFQHWIFSNNIQHIPNWGRQFIFAKDEYVIRGMRDPSFVFIGTYMKRPDWYYLVRTLSVYRDFPREILYGMSPTASYQDVNANPPPKMYIDCPFEHKTDDDQLMEDLYGAPY